MTEVVSDLILHDLENEYMKKHNTYLIEDKILYSFSKRDIYRLIKDTERIYMKSKILHAQSIYKQQQKYGKSDINLFDKEFIRLNEHYFNGGVEIEKTKKFLNRIKNFYKAHYVKNKYNGYKHVDIKSIPIDRVIGMYIKLPNNLNRNIRCPFHNEKTGSFRVYKHTNSFYCFGCQKGGNVVNFISLYENISSRNAFKKIINLFG